MVEEEWGEGGASRLDKKGNGGEGPTGKKIYDNAGHAGGNLDNYPFRAGPHTLGWKTDWREWVDEGSVGEGKCFYPRCCAFPSRKQPC